MGQFTVRVPPYGMVLEATGQRLIDPASFGHELRVPLDAAVTDAFDVRPVVRVRGDGCENDARLSGGERVVELVEPFGRGSQGRVEAPTAPVTGGRIAVREPCPVALLARPHQRGPMSSIQNWRRLVAAPAKVIEAVPEISARRRSTLTVPLAGSHRNSVWRV